MKKCPMCRLINPNEAEECDCGYNFETRTVQRDTEKMIIQSIPIIQIIFTVLLLIVLVSLFCIHNHIGAFIYFSYQFTGIAGLFLLWFITIICIAVMIIPTIISWTVFYKKNKSLNRKY
ncbi:MAG: hypothetical protein ACYDG2_14615 [Ruminiclostridium sp.]